MVSTKYNHSKDETVLLFHHTICKLESKNKYRIMIGMILFLFFSSKHFGIKMYRIMRKREFENIRSTPGMNLRLRFLLCVYFIRRTSSVRFFFPCHKIGSNYFQCWCFLLCRCPHGYLSVWRNTNIQIL